MCNLYTPHLIKIETKKCVLGDIIDLIELIIEVGTWVDYLV